MTYPWEDLENEEYMYRIMIVEDDEVIANAIRQHLVSCGMEAFCVQDFSDVLTEFAATSPQLVLMDIHLPFFNGYHWCQEIRNVSKVPILFLSSASDNMSIIMAVNMGGDDFIEKPFDLNVLTAKVQALLRRTYEFAGTKRGDRNTHAEQFTFLRYICHLIRYICIFQHLTYFFDIVNIHIFIFPVHKNRNQLAGRRLLVLMNHCLCHPMIFQILFQFFIGIVILRLQLLAKIGQSGNHQHQYNQPDSYPFQLF